MSKFPGSREVDRALKNVAREVKSALKGLNQQAAKLLSRGDYTGAEALVQMGRSINEFQVEVEALAGKWDQLQGGGAEAESRSSEKTALWEYYQPILQALVVLGGEATSPQLEEKVGPLLEGRLKQGDRATMSDGRPRWKVLVKRARRHMVREGFIENTAGPRWRISASGRKAAEGGKPIHSGD
jgi:hypothetical protein